MITRFRLILGSISAGLLIAAGGDATAQRSSSGLNEFLADHGVDARVRFNFDTGHPSEVFGQAIDLGWTPVSDSDFESAARSILDNYPGMFGFSSDSLQTLRVKRVDLSRIGSSDKVGVVFQQEIEGLPVEGGFVTVLFHENGKLLNISNRGLPGVDELDLVPTVTSGQAGQIAVTAFGRDVLVQKDIEIAIVPNQGGTGPALAWNVNLLATEWENNLPVAEQITIDAHTGVVLRKESTIHSFVDLLGRVRGWGSPGVLPDTSANPAIKHKLEFVSAQSSSGNVDTDSDGKFTIPNGGASPVSVTVNFGSTSTYARVINQAGGNLGKTKSVTPGVVSRFRFNQNSVQRRTSQINAQKELITFLNWVDSIDPSDNTMFFQQRMNVNISSTCNAFYDGSSTNYYLSGSGCPNTAYSTVIAHETGHWANSRYGHGNGSDGFGEGNADNFATFIYDTPIVGQNFCGSGCHVRNALNNRQYCGSCGAGCYGGVHANGEVLMGACWKARDRLNNSLGDAAGDLVADTIFLAWVNLYPGDRTICQIIDDHWLTIDDNDGNLNNGTPNGNDIDNGFKDQGFPGFY